MKTKLAELLVLPLDDARRDEIIERIIQQDIDVNSGENDWYLRSLLENGCKGLANMTDEELVDDAETVLSDEEEDLDD